MWREQPAPAPFEKQPFAREPEQLRGVGHTAVRGAQRVFDELVLQLGDGLRKRLIEADLPR